MIQASKNEEAPPPIPTPVTKEYLDCSYLCFYVDPSIYDKNGFRYKFPDLASNLNHSEIHMDSNLILLCVFCDGFGSGAINFFKKTHNFEVSYIFKDKTFFSCEKAFTVDVGKIKFIYNSGNNGTFSDNRFRNPSYLEQYKVFDKISNRKKELIEQTKEVLSKNLDIELFLYLLENRKDETEELMKILVRFPELTIIYDKNKPLPDFNFTNFSKDEKNNKILFMIYSIIQDSINLLTNINEEDILYFLQYNDKRRGKIIFIKKNIFLFFIEKCNNNELIKKICKSIPTIPLLFDYLSSLIKVNFDKIKNLTFNDLPHEYIQYNDLFELIEKYENVSDAFTENEIEKVWKKYIEKYIDKNDIKELEKVIDKFKETNENRYKNIIQEIKKKIITRGKDLIHQKKFKNLDMYEFIIKYDNIGNILSDASIIFDIGKNVILEKFDTNKNIIEKFNECDFLSKIDSSLILYYIKGTLEQVYNFDKLKLYFKYIYTSKEKQETEKNIIFVNMILSHFTKLLAKNPNLKINPDFKEIFQKIILLSLMYIENEKDNNFYINIINNLSHCSLSENIFYLFLETIINADLNRYISDYTKDNVCEYIIKNFYSNLAPERKIDFLLLIKSDKLKEKMIFVDFPKLEYKDFLNLEESESLNYLNLFLKKNIINNDEYIKYNYFNELRNKCKLIKNDLKEKKIKFSDVIKLKYLIKNNKLLTRINLICFGALEESEKLEKIIQKYSEEYIKYRKELEKLIRYYGKYFPFSKKSEIDLYSKDLINFKESKICHIKLNELIYDEIKTFKKYELSKFFVFIYNTLTFKNEKEKIEKDLKEQEEENFNKTIELFNKCENLFNGKDFELQFLEIPLINWNLMIQIKIY